MEMQLEPGARGQSRTPDEARQPLTLLFGVTVIVLLICCANVANLLLARAAEPIDGDGSASLDRRRPQTHRRPAARRVDAARRDRGGSEGFSSRAGRLTRDGGHHCPAAAEALTLAARCATCCCLPAALSLATGLLFGLFPALHSTRPNLVSALKANAGQPSGAKAAARFRVTLATAQIALSMALLMSAGLFTKSLLNISRVDLGLETDKLVVFGVSPAMNGL